MLHALDQLNQTSAVWWEHWGHAAWQAAAIGVIVYFSVWLLRNKSPLLRFGLLLIAFLKFAVPPFATAPFGAMAVLADIGIPVSHSVPVDQRAASSETRYTAPRLAREELYNIGSDEQAEGAWRTSAVGSEDSLTAHWRRGTSDSQRVQVSFASLLMLLHLFGSTMATIWIGTQFLRIRHVIQARCTESEKRVIGTFHELSSELALRAPPRLIISCAKVSPFSCGVVRPTVVIPTLLVERLGDDELRSVMTHELAHIRRRDLWWSTLSSLLLMAWWFHPVFWLVTRKLREVCEECCDDVVVGQGVDSQDACCKTLLRVARLRAFRQLGTVAVGMSARPYPLANRLRRIMDGSISHSVKLGWPACIGLILAGAVMLPGVRGKNAPQRAPGHDLYGDSLPPFAMARLGTIRFRHHRNLAFAAFAQNGLVLVVSRNEGKIYYYESPSGEFLRSVPITKMSVQAAAMTADRNQLAVYGFRFNEDETRHDYFLDIVEGASGRLLHHHAFAEPPWVPADATGFAFENGLVAICSSRGQVALLDIVTGETIREHDFGNATRLECATFVPDSTLLYLGGRNRTYVWSTDSPDEPGTIPFGRPDERMNCVSMVLNHDSSILAVGLSSVEIALIDVKTRSVLGFLNDEQYKTGYARSIEFSVDDRRLISTTGDDAVLIWDLEDGRLSEIRNGWFQLVSHLDASPNGTSLLIGAKFDDSVDVVQWPSLNPIGRSTRAHTQPPNFVAFTGIDDKLASASDDGSLRIWNAASGKQLFDVVHSVIKPDQGRWIRGAAVSPDGTRVATSSLDDTVRVWNAHDGREIYRLPGHGRLGGVRELRFSADGQTLTSWGDDMKLYQWDMGTGETIHETLLLQDREIPGNDPFGFETRPLNGSCMSPDGRLLLVMFRSSHHLLEIPSGRSLRLPEIVAGPYATAALSPGNKVLVSSWLGPPTETPLKDGRSRFSAGENHILTFYRLNENDAFREIVLPDAVFGPLAYSPDGTLLAVGSGNNDVAIRIFRTDDYEEIARISHLMSDPSSIAISRDNKRIAAGMHDTSVLIWQVDELVNSAD